MAFLRHPQSIALEFSNAECLRRNGLDPGLAKGFGGRLVCKGDTDYDKDRQLSDPAFQKYPKLIAYCGTEVDVAWCLRLANIGSLPFTCRSGGHSTAGYSVVDNGLVIDMSNFNFVFPQSSDTVIIGPGVRFGDLNRFLSLYDVHIPGGGCSDVRIGGYMQGGGYGFTSREFGMHCDNVAELRVMLWDTNRKDGRTVVAGPNNEYSDLFWAVRGGTGNNFGVVTAVTYNLHKLKGIWGVWLQWPLDQGVDQAAKALALLQNQYMLSGAPNTFGYMVLITAQGPNNVPVMMVRAMFDGSRGDLDQLLQPLVNAGGVAPPGIQSPRWGSYADMNEALMETPYGIPQLPSGQTWGEDKQSGYIAQTLQVSVWQRILQYFLTSFTGSNPYGYVCPYTTVVLEPMGGAINSRPTSYNAFVHRTAATDFFCDVFWQIPGNQEQPAKQWLDRFMELMAPYFNGECYQNYPRAKLVGLPDYKRAYWASNYPALVRVKKKYDPANFFNFPQSINPNDAVA